MANYSLLEIFILATEHEIHHTSLDTISRENMNEPRAAAWMLPDKEAGDIN